jgi:hypothetical protein
MRKLEEEMARLQPGFEWTAAMQPAPGNVWIWVVLRGIEKRKPIDPRERLVYDGEGFVRDRLPDDPPLMGYEQRFNVGEFLNVGVDVLADWCSRKVTAELKRVGR